MSFANLSASVDAIEETRQGLCSLSHSPLNLLEITNAVGDDSAGAIVSFVGTTRNSFHGKIVTRLEYQAYSKLAIKTMSSIAAMAGQQVPSIVKYAIVHRLGVVPVGEASIVIAVSSPHRQAAFEACELILEEVKQRGQIWKREYYEGEREDEAAWKANNG